VYFVPYGTTNDFRVLPHFTTLARYDTRMRFEDPSAFTLFDLSRIPDAGTAHQGAIFDGRFLYVIPRAGTVVLRFDAREPPAPPPTPPSFL
jgi:hypothetical protein